MLQGRIFGRASCCHQVRTSPVLQSRNVVLAPPERDRARRRPQISQACPALRCRLFCGDIGRWDLCRSAFLCFAGQFGIPAIVAPPGRFIAAALLSGLLRLQVGFGLFVLDEFQHGAQPLVLGDRGRCDALILVESGLPARYSALIDNHANGHLFGQNSTENQGLICHGKTSPPVAPLAVTRKPAVLSN